MPSTMIPCEIVEYFDSVASTQDTVRRWIKAHESFQGFYWALAHKQNEGRGRSGKSWQSFEGNLMVNLVTLMLNKWIHLLKLD